MSSNVSLTLRAAFRSVLPWSPWFPEFGRRSQAWTWIYHRHTRGFCHTSTMFLGSKSQEPVDPTRESEADQFNVETQDQKNLNKLKVLKDYLEKNRYFEKYKDKILNLQRSSPKEFTTVLNQLGNDCKTSDYKTLSFLQTKDDSKQRKLLDNVLHLDILGKLDRDDIIFVWNEYHRKKGTLGTVIPGSVYNKMVPLAQKYKMFVLPVPRSDGFEFHVVHFENDVFHLTPLISYQTYKENSPVSLTLTYFTELKGDKDIVLVMGEFDKNVMTIQMAYILHMQINLYYSEECQSRTELLRRFTESPDSFNHFDLIEEFKKLNEKYSFHFE